MGLGSLNLGMNMPQCRCVQYMSSVGIQKMFRDTGRAATPEILDSRQEFDSTQCLGLQ